MVNESGAKRGIVVRWCSSSWDARHVPAEQRRFRRVHGLQLPLHPQQVVGWVLLIAVFAGTFSVLLPLLPELRLGLSLLFAALFLLHVSSHLTVLLLDPADPEVRARPARAVVPEFDRAKHRHVIENGRCHLCNITTRGRRTKHCSICNKCVPRFDHHCKWLNNCIGGRNYPAFLGCLASTLVVALAVTALALGELVLVTAPSSSASWWNSTQKGMSNGSEATPPLLPVLGTGSLVLVTVIGVLSAVAAVLLIHLCFFHGYIACLGLTTYEYVRRKRERGRPAAVAAAPAAAPAAAADDDRMVLGARRGFYSRFCDSRTSAATTTTTDVYVCSTPEEMRNAKDAKDMKDISAKSLPGPPSTKGSSRNFRLCFSYDSRTTETSIQVSSSQTTATDATDATDASDASELRSYVESPEAKSSSTPSPVSCCFSVMNASHRVAASSRHDAAGSGGGRKHRRPGEPAKRSCGTMRRIQTFLQTRLRKGSRQRLTTSAIARHCGNKIIPQAASPPDVASAEDQDRSGFPEAARTAAPATPATPAPDYADYPRPPTRLPALDPLPLPRDVRKARKVSSSTVTDISVLGPMPACPKRNRAHLRPRRNASFSKKRPRFKVGSHVVTQTAQLSPIPESEFSKPATPRSPSRSGSIFAFPPLRE